MPRKYDQFEVIDAYGGRHRFRYADGFSWAWGVLPGTIDTDDLTRLEVWRAGDDPDEDSYRFAVFPHPALVGDVDDSCTHEGYRLREKQRPVWIGGLPVNLAAAAADAGEWLALIKQLHDVRRWPFGDSRSPTKLAACRDALRKFIAES